MAWNRLSPWKSKALICIFIVLLAVFLRAWGVLHIANDHDECIYLDASQNYASFMLKLDLKHLVYFSENYEHPVFAKLVYALALIGAPLESVECNQLNDDRTTYPPVQQMQLRARTVSALFGVLTTALLAFINPLAGLFFAIHTFAVQFTSVVYLEAIPTLTSLVAVWAYDQWDKYRQPTNTHRQLFLKHLWLGISAFALGLSVASKYVYVVAGIAIAIHYIWRTLHQSHTRVKRMGLLLAWGLLAMVVFFFADPYLWVKTPSRLYKSLTFSVNYASDEHVTTINYPFWQPVVWLTKSVPQHPYKAIPSVPDSFWLQPDLLIALLVPFGLPRLIQRRGPYASWLLTGLLFLFIWETKWPQYVLIILAPWCLSAAEGLAFLVSMMQKVSPWGKV